MSDVLCTIIVPVALIEAANEAALTWDLRGGQATFKPAFLSSSGQVPATHSACSGLIQPEYATAIAAAITANFPGVLLFQGVTPTAALVSAGLSRIPPLPLL
jgi:hypothetical protein